MNDGLLKRDPEVQAELVALLDQLKNNDAYYRSWVILRESRVTGRITLKFDKGLLKGIEPSPYIGVTSGLDNRKG